MDLSEEPYLHLYNVQNAITVLEQKCNDRNTQYTVLKCELNNVKKHNISLPIADYMKLMKQLELDLSVESPNDTLFQTLLSLLTCPLLENERVPIGAHRKILDVTYTQLKDGTKGSLLSMLKIIENCLPADLYFHLVEMNPESFSDLFKNYMNGEDLQIKCLVMQIYTKLYLDNIISLLGIISLINYTMDTLLENVIPLIFDDNSDTRRHALLLMQTLQPAFVKSSYITKREWATVKLSFANKYSTKLLQQVSSNEDIWHDIWILAVKLLAPEIQKSANVMNKLLCVIESGLKNQTQISNTWLCWKVLIGIYGENSGGIATLKYIKLLSCPFKRQLRYDTSLDKMFISWLHLFVNIKPSAFDEHCSLLVPPFLEFCFGIQNTATNNVCSIDRTEKIFPEIVSAFMKMIGVDSEFKSDPIIDKNMKAILVSSTVFMRYWKEIVQCVGEMTRHLTKLNPLIYKWNEIASSVWRSVLKAARQHFVQKEKLNEVNEEILRILTVLIQMSQNNQNLTWICLQSLIVEIDEHAKAIKHDEIKNDIRFKLLDLATHVTIVSYLDKPQAEPVYERILTSLLNGHLMSFAGNKIINMMKNHIESIPTVIYNIICRSMPDKLPDSQNGSNETELVTQTMQQFLLFPIEYFKILKMTQETVDSLKLLHKKYISLTENQDDLSTKFMFDVCSEIRSKNELIFESRNDKNSQYLLSFISYMIGFTIDRILKEPKENDSERLALILQVSQSVLKTLQENCSHDSCQLAINLTNKVCHLLKLTSTSMFVKLLKNFEEIFKVIFDFKRSEHFVNYNKEIVPSLEVIAEYILEFKTTDLSVNEAHAMDKMTKYFISLCKNFPLSTNLIALLSSKQNKFEKDSITHTPTRTPKSLLQPKNVDQPVSRKLAASSKESLSLSSISSPISNLKENFNTTPNTKLTPKSRRSLDNDFVVIPKTPVQKPKYTEKQREKMIERRADIPPLYNELSQQSQDASLLSVSDVKSIFDVGHQRVDNISVLELSINDADINKTTPSNKITPLARVPSVNKNGSDKMSIDEISPNLIQDSAPLEISKSKHAKCLDFRELKEKIDVVSNSSSTVSKSRLQESCTLKKIEMRNNSKQEDLKLDSVSESDSESVTSLDSSIRNSKRLDSGARNSKKLAKELKLLAIDIIDGDKFTNLSNRRLRRDSINCKQLSPQSSRKKISHQTNKKHRNNSENNKRTIKDAIGNNDGTEKELLEKNKLHEPLNELSSNIENTNFESQMEQWLDKAQSNHDIQDVNCFETDDVGNDDVTLISNNIINVEANNSPEIAESADIVMSSQEPSQTLFLKGSRSNSPNMSLKKLDDDLTNKSTYDLKSPLKEMTEHDNQPIIVLEDISPKLKSIVNLTTEVDEVTETNTKFNLSKIASSPEHDNDLERNAELLNNTIDISPIKLADEPVEFMPLRENLIVTATSSPVNGKRFSNGKSLLTKSRGAQMLGLCNKEVAESVCKITDPTKCLSPIPTNSRSAKLLMLSDNDLLTFKKEVPSPLASPSVGILKRGVKRKLTEDLDLELPPNKSKRVSFNDPIFTTKYLIKEGSSNKSVENVPSVCKQLMDDEKAFNEMNTDNIESCCSPVESEKIISDPDSEDIMNIEHRIRLEKSMDTQENTGIRDQHEIQDTIDILQEDFNSCCHETVVCASNDPLDDFSDFKELSPERHVPIFPELITCLDPIGDVIDGIFLKSRIESVRDFRKNMFTISDLANMSSQDVQNAPFRSPKLVNLKKILETYEQNWKNDLTNTCVETGTTKEPAQDEDATQVISTESVIEHTEDNCCMSNLVKNNDPNKLYSNGDNDLHFSALNCINIESFDESTLKNFLERIFSAQPLQTFDVVQGVIKNVLLQNVPK